MHRSLRDSRQSKSKSTLSPRTLSPPISTARKATPEAYGGYSYNNKTFPYMVIFPV